MAKVKVTKQATRTKSTARAKTRTASAATNKSATATTGAVNAAAKETAVKALETATKALEKIIANEPNRAPQKAPDFAAEIGAIDFNKMISGPLQAAVDAQVAASLATVEFINAVGFTGEGADRELVMVDFSHKKNDVDADGNVVPTETFIRVPLLAMVQVPSLRIEHVIIDFNVKLNSVETANTSSSLGVDASVQGGWGPVKFKVSASYKRSSSTGIKVEREYALNVNVKAVQDEIAPGLEKILNLLAA